MPIARLVSLTLMIGSTMGTAQSAPAPQQEFGGAPVSGICFLSREAVFTNAKAAKAATAQLQQFTVQAQAQVDDLRKSAEADAKSLRADAAKLTPEQRRPREIALAAKQKAVQDRTAQVNREIEATRNKATNRIAIALQPVVEAAYKQKNCGLLINRNSVLGGNLANDLTPAAVAGLDVAMSTITFEREILPSPSVGAPKPVVRKP